MRKAWFCFVLNYLEMNCPSYSSVCSLNAFGYSGHNGDGEMGKTFKYLKLMFFMCIQDG